MNVTGGARCTGVFTESEEREGCGSRGDECGHHQAEAEGMGDLARARSLSVKPETTGTTASALRAAALAMALLTPDATLTWSGSAAAITVAVSGATKVTSPMPNTTAPGRTSVTHDASSPMRASNSSPAAASSGPTVSCRPRPDPLGQRA